MSHILTTGRGDLRLDLRTDALTLHRMTESELLLTAPSPALLVPSIDGAPVPVTIGEIHQEGERIEIPLLTADDAAVEKIALSIEATEDALDFQVEFTARRDCELNALGLLPLETGLSFYDLVNFRNRHRTDRTWPELTLGHSIETSTFSDDWQFAPHPTAVVLRKNAIHLFVGFLELQPAYGMRIAVAHNQVKRWDVCFGPVPHGLKLKAGETFRSARLRLFLNEGESVHEVYKEAGRALVAEGLIPDPAKKVRHDWWLEPIYCTWGDQTMLARRIPEDDLAAQTAGTVAEITAKLTQDLVREVVQVIRREKLPVRTIILDEGWNVARGDWRPHPDRFPDLRGLVDELHAQGFRVMVWWSWAELDPKADLNPNELVQGGAWKNRHGSRWRDYSDPRIQEEYLKPLFHQLFSSEPGCYDLDGVKTDFLADKVHPETVLADPSWRGEEIFFLKMTELCYREMRRHKPDALHLGCAGHYWLAEFIDLNRTYDVHSTNWLEHEERALMLQCTAPGVVVSYDMMNFTENMDKYFASARKLGAAVELGNVLVQKDHPFANVRDADERFLDILRAGCA